MSRGLGGWLLGAAVALAASTALAGPSVVVVVDAGAAATEADVARLRSELGALGFDVSTVERPPGVQAIDELARARGAEAAVRLIEHGVRLEIWMRDRDTGRTVVREVIVEDPDPERAASVLAVRAGELLRAALLDAGPAPAPQPAAAAAAPPSGDVGLGAGTLPTPPRDEPRQAVAAWPPGPSWGVDAGPTLLWMPGQDVAPTVVITIGARLMLAPWLTFGVRADLPTFAVTAEGSEGKAEIHAGSVSTVLRLEPAALLRWRLQPFAEAAVGGGWVDVRGLAPTSGYVADDGARLSLLVALRGGARVSVVAPLSLRADAGAAMSLPPVRVTFAGREVLEAGRLWLMAGLGADCTF